MLEERLEEQLEDRAAGADTPERANRWARPCGPPLLQCRPLRAAVRRSKVSLYVQERGCRHRSARAAAGAVLGRSGYFFVFQTQHTTAEEAIWFAVFRASELV